MAPSPQPYTTAVGPPQGSCPARGAEDPTMSAWPRRMLAAGCWYSLICCLGCQPGSLAMQQVVSIGIMYLAKEVREVREIAHRGGRHGGMEGQSIPP